MKSAVSRSESSSRMKESYVHRCRGSQSREFLIQSHIIHLGMNNVEWSDAPNEFSARDETVFGCMLDQNVTLKQKSRTDTRI